MSDLNALIDALPFPDRCRKRLDWLRGYLETDAWFAPPQDRAKAQADADALRRVLRLVQDEPEAAAALRRRLDLVEASLAIPAETQRTTRQERDYIVAQICEAIASGLDVDVAALGAGLKPDGSAPGQLTGDSATVARIIQELRIFEESEHTIRERVKRAIAADGPTLWRRLRGGGFEISIGGQLSGK